MVAVWRNFKWFNTADDHTITDGTDDAPKIRAMMDRLNKDGRGGVVVFQRTDQPYQFDTTIEVKRDEEFQVPAGVWIQTRGGRPAFKYIENHGSVTGRGKITALNGSPDGLIEFGNGAGAAVDPVLWCHLHRLQLSGDSTPGSIGIKFAEDPNVRGNYWNDVHAVHVERVETGIHAEELANAQKFRGVDFQLIGAPTTPGDFTTMQGGVIFKFDSDENQILGGSVHQSRNCIVHQFNETIYNISKGLVAEPGGTSSFAHINGVGSLGNVIDGIANTTAANVNDNPERNSIKTQSIRQDGRLRNGWYGETPVTQPPTNADIHTTGLAAAP